MLSVNNIRKSFSGAEAVSSLSFSVNRGEIFGIVGPDGAGKSTLMRLMSTILVPDEGSISIGGIEAHKNPYAIKKLMAYMPQRFGLYEDLTVEENIFFFGRLFGVRKSGIRERLAMLYGFSGLGPFRERLAGNLSGGMKQKLGLACCLVHRPEIILLDEPTNGVDPVSRREFWKILYDLLSGGVTIIVSTSYLDEAERCSRVALMYRGSFIRTGIPAKIKSGIGKKLLAVTVDRPIDGEMALRGAEGMPGVIRTGNTLKLFVDDSGLRTKEISSILKKKGIRVMAEKIIPPTLEDCFFEIVAEGA